jgi:hypothetical protein
MKLHWLTATFLSVVAMIPAWMAPNFLKRNFGIELVPFMFWYYLALCSALLVCLKFTTENGQVLTKLAPSWGPILGIFVFGLTVGFIGNITTFIAVTEAPNPGLPNAIKNLQTVGLLFVSAWLGSLLPKYFVEAKVDGWQILGVALTVIGATIITIRR